MTLLHLLILIIIVGVILWGINTFIPMASVIKRLLNFLVFILLLIYILQFFHLIPTLIPFPTGFK